MRISTIKGDPGYRNDASSFAIKFNGTWIFDCLIADEEKRLVVRLVTINGKNVIRGGKPKTFTSRGEVQIIPNRRKNG